MPRLNSLQVWVTDLVASARFYGEFLGLELADQPHRHPGNQALHYDVAWGNIASGESMMLQLAQSERDRHTTGAQIGIAAVVHRPPVTEPGPAAAS